MPPGGGAFVVTNQQANHRAICDTTANHQIALHHSTSNDVNNIDALSGGRHGRGGCGGGRHGRDAARSMPDAARESCAIDSTGIPD